MNEGYSAEQHLFPYHGISPKIGKSVFFASGSKVIGDVTLGDEVSVWYNAVIRADIHYVSIGAGTNIQDGSICHVTRGTHPLVVGSRVTVGHGAILHGCTVEDLTLIGMGAIVLDGAVVRKNALVAAGAVVTPDTEVPSGTLFGGIPGKVLRELTDEERAKFAESAHNYRDLARTSAESLARR